MIRAALSGFALGLFIAVLSASWAYNRGKISNEARHIAAFAAVQAENLAKQKSIILSVQKVAEDADLEQVDLERRLAGADLAVVRLQQTIRDANSRADSAATTIADAARARTLLARCAQRYRDVAERADRLRANVLGLQAYTRTIASE